MNSARASTNDEVIDISAGVSSGASTDVSIGYDVMYRNGQSERMIIG
jgi:hypothetical protein